MAGPGRPAKRKRISADQAEQAKILTNTAIPRRQHDLRLKSRFDAIFNKYGHDFDGIGDIIDITTGEILVDNGHVSRMRHAGDIGVEVIRTKPAAIPVAKRRKATSYVKDTEANAKPEEEEHDELTSPARPREQDVMQDEGHDDGREEAEQSMTLPEQQCSTPGASGEPRMAPPADMAARILQKVVPWGQQVNLNDPAQLALYTQNLVQEILRQTTNAPSNPLILPTPPTSARSGPIRPFRSVWGGEDAYHSEDDGAEDVEDAEIEEEEAIETQPMSEPTRRVRRTWQSDEKAKLLKLRDVDGLTFASIGRILNRRNAFEKYAALTKGRDQVKETSLTTRRAIESGRRATIASSGIDSINISRSREGPPSTDGSKRRTRQSLPAIAVVAPQLEETRLRNLRPRKSLNVKTIAQPSADGLNHPADTPMSRRKTKSPEAVDTLEAKTSPKQSTDAERTIRRGPGRPCRQEPQQAIDENEQLKETPRPTIVDKEQIKPDEERRRRPGRPRRKEPQPVTSVPKQQSEDASAPQAIDKEHSNTTPSYPNRKHANNVLPGSAIQAPPPPPARSRLRRVSQRLSNVAPTESPIAQAHATSIDLSASMPPPQADVSAVQQQPPQPPIPHTQTPTLPQPPPAAADPSPPSNTPGSAARLKQARAERMSGIDIRRVSGGSSVMPRRIVSSATSETPMIGTGALSSAVRRHVVRQDDLGSEDELDQ